MPRLLERVCEQCGDLGYPNLLVRCRQCRKAYRHAYCLEAKVCFVPHDWECQDCLDSAKVSYEEWRTIASSHHEIKETAAIVKLPFGGQTCLKSDVKITKQRSKKSCMRRADPLKNTKVKYLPNEEAALLTSGITARTNSRIMSSRLFPSQTNKQKSTDGQSHWRATNDGEMKRVIGKLQGKECKLRSATSSVYNSRSLPSISKITRLYTESPPSEKTPQHEMMGKVKGGKPDGDPQPHRGISDKSYRSRNKDVGSAEKDPFQSRRDCWRGGFEIFDGLFYLHLNMSACLPANLPFQAFGAVERFPENLRFKLLPRRDLWPKLFREDPPDMSDVGLIFFPSNDERSKAKHAQLLEKIDKGDLAMRSSLGSTSLLVYTSKQLPKNSQGTDGTFLWGVIWRRRRRKKEINSKQSMEEKTELDKEAALNTGSNLFMKKRAQLHEKASAKSKTNQILENRGWLTEKAASRSNSKQAVNKRANLNKEAAPGTRSMATVDSSTQRHKTEETRRPLSLSQPSYSPPPRWSSPKSVPNLSAHINNRKKCTSTGRQFPCSSTFQGRSFTPCSTIRIPKSPDVLGSHTPDQNATNGQRPGPPPPGFPIRSRSSYPHPLSKDLSGSC